MFVSTGVAAGESANATGGMFPTAVGRARLLVVLVFLAAAMVSTPGTASAAPVCPVPDPDPFYLQLLDLGARQPGDVLAVRPMPPLPLFPATTVRQVEFRSTNSAGHPIAATSLILLPGNRRPDGPLLSYQHIINGLSPRCAPSRALDTTDANVVIREAPALNGVLLQGWTVALPDHLGPDSAYGAARLGGQITLDGIRAVQRAPELGLTRSPVAMAGYSGGGMATAWAAAMAPSTRRSRTSSGSPRAACRWTSPQMAKVLGNNPHPAFGLAMAAALGLEREYPDRFSLSEQLNTSGRAVRDAMANGCTNDILRVGAGRSASRVDATSMQLVSDAEVPGRSWTKTASSCIRACRGRRSSNGTPPTMC